MCFLIGEHSWQITSHITRPQGNIAHGNNIQRTPASVLCDLGYSKALNLIQKYYLKAVLLLGQKYCFLLPQHTQRTPDIISHDYSNEHRK